MAECVRDPGPGRVLLAKPGPGKPRLAGPCVDEKEFDVLGPACANLLISPLTCRIDCGAGIFLVE
jgi:hypothetical protein